MESFNLKTKDNVKIAVDYYNKGKKEVVILAPGWCMTKNSNAFVEISNFFSESFDVLCFDFRGHGKSGGSYTFSAKEELDLEAVVNFAKEKNYEKIYLTGFSLGAAVCLNYSAKCPVDKIIAVSAPCDFNKIENQMWKKEAWGETFKKFELKRFLSIRPNLIPYKKTKTIDVIEEIEAPTLFIAGGKDPTVHAWHTELLYNKAKCKKDYKLYEKGCHAEDLFLHFKKDFMETCLNWLKN